MTVEAEAGKTVHAFKRVQAFAGRTSFPEFLGFMGKTVFLDDHYLVYRISLDRLNTNRACINHPGWQGRAHAPEDARRETFRGIVIEKGDPAFLEDVVGAQEGLPGHPCHIMDGVRDFFVARDESGIQHISWIYRKEHHNRLLALGDGEVEIKYCLTMPTQRGRGIYPKVLGVVLAHLRREGIRAVYMCVRPDNHPSIRGIEKAGFRLVGRIRYWKILGVIRSKPITASKLTTT